MLKIKNTSTNTPMIIHPGKKLEILLQKKNIKQKELAIRTNVSEKHVSTIINGSKDISVSFAKKLEYALGIDAEIWIRLQAQYDQEMQEAEEYNNISEDEINLLKPLKEITDYAISEGIITENKNKVNLVLGLRSALHVSNLTIIPQIPYYAAYRAQVSKNVNVDEYVLYAWQCICEKLTENIDIADTVDKQLLLNKIPEIKKIMFERGNAIPRQLESIFAQCGIAFKIVKHFRGAPVQGFIKYSTSNRLILCMTIRQARADVFWFTLFHEIGHIINGDVSNLFVDFSSVSGDIEGKADEFAGNCLLDYDAYKIFVTKRDYSIGSIEEFAKSQKVKKDIVIGRLQRDEIIGWEKLNNHITKYAWAE